MRFLSDWRVRGSLAALALGGLAVFTLSGTSGTNGSSLLGQLNPFTKNGIQHAANVTPNLHSQYGKLPLFFEKNEGQVHSEVKYLSRGAGYTLYLTADEAVFQLAQPKENAKVNNVLRARLLGANRSAKTVGEKEQPGRSNYFVGNDSSQWHSNIANYGRVRYEAVYPGIDLVYYGNQGQLEYDFVVKPGSNPDAIRLAYGGTTSLYLDEEGNLIAETEAGSVKQFKPVAYQHINGQRQAVESRFVLAQNSVSFQLGDYDHQHELVIDPVLVYSTFLGGGVNHSLSSIAVDNAGNAYIAGITTSTNYPQKNALSNSVLPSDSNSMAIISKLSANGSELLYSTYLGGTIAYGDDCIPACSDSSLNGALTLAVSPDGSAYVGGLTNTTNFPTLNAVQADNNNPKGSSFVSKLSASGQALVFSTYLGGGEYANGGSTDAISALTLRSATIDNGIIAVGQTGGKNFPTTTGAHLETLDTHNFPAGFATALDENGARVFSTYIGGAGDSATAIAVDSTGGIHIAGTTNSGSFVTTDGSDAHKVPGVADAFYLRLSSDGSNISFATLFGGNGGIDESKGIAINPVTQDVWIIGTTQSSDFPTDNADADIPTYAVFLRGYDSTNVKIGSHILGKPGSTGTTNAVNHRSGLGKAVAIDQQGNIYVAGQMLLAGIERVDAISNPTFPPVSTPTAYLSNFISKLASDGQTVIYTTDLRGNKGEMDLLNGGVQGIALDSGGSLYVAGTTYSDNFPTINALYPTSTSGSEWKGFVAKLGEGPSITMNTAPSVIVSGGSSTLSWSVDNTAVSCTANSTPFNASFQGAQVIPPAGSSQTVLLTESSVGDHTYSLTCTDASGNESTAFTSIRVAGAPQITFTLSKPAVIMGETSLLSWSVIDANNGNGDKCEATSTSGTQFSGNKLNTGSVLVSSSTAGSISYTLSCEGYDGIDYPATTTLTIHNPPTVTLTAVTANSGYAMVGESITWNWTSTDTTDCDLSGAIAETGVGSSGSRPFSPSTFGSETLNIVCTGPTGATTTASSSVTVYDESVSPTLSFGSNRAPGNTIMGRQSVMFSWAATNAESCAASSNAPITDTNWNGAKPISGSIEITPPEPTGGYGNSIRYTLTCSRPGAGGTTTSDIDITVNYPRPSHTATLSSSSVQTGETVTFTWNSQDAVKCEASGFLEDNNLPTSGSRTLTAPDTEGTQTIWLKCLNADGAANNIVAYSFTTYKPSNNVGDGSGSGGGSFDPFILVGLGLAGWRLRKQAAQVSN